MEGACDLTNTGEVQGDGLLCHMLFLDVEFEAVEIVTTLIADEFLFGAISKKVGTAVITAKLLQGTIEIDSIIIVNNLLSREIYNCSGDLFNCLLHVKAAILIYPTHINARKSVIVAFRQDSIPSIMRGISFRRHDMYDSLAM